MIIQKEVTADRDLRQSRGTTKAAVLEGDPDCPGLIACSVYDTKPVHFLTNSVHFVCWILCKKRLYDPRKKEMVWNEFLRTNLQDDYNNGMDDVDVSDQLRTIYRFDYWLRNQKWWWAMWMWGVSVVIVNVYVLYVAIVLSPFDTTAARAFKNCSLEHITVLFRAACANQYRIYKILGDAYRRHIFQNYY